MRSSRCLPSAVGAAIALATLPALADETPPAGGKEGVFTLGEIAVTGPAEAEAAPTEDVVTAKQMLRFDRKTVADAANLVPGVTVSRTGARNEGTLYVRGFDVKHAPLFLDGIPIYVPYDGYPDLNRFFTYDLSEVVISKGFTSVLYGPNTMGGAINMVSLRPTKPIEAMVAAGYSTGHTYDLFANLGTKQKLWYLEASGSWENSTGFDLSSHFHPTANEDGGRRNNSYHRDFKLSAKAAFTPNDRDEYALSFILQSGKKGTPPYTGTNPKPQGGIKYWQWPYWDKRSVYFTSNTGLGEKSYVKARAYYDIFQNSLFSFDDATYSTMSKPYAFASNYDDYTLGGSVEAGTDLIPFNTLKVAVHFKDDVHREVNSATSPKLRFEDRMFSVGVEDTIRLSGALYAVAGVSYDTINAVEAQRLVSGAISGFPLHRTDAWNPQAGLFYAVTDTGTVHAAVSRKSRLPSIKDRYSFRLGTALASPDLSPEHSINYEIGYEDSPLKQLRYKATGFFDDVRDYILLATGVAPNPKYDPEDPKSPATLDKNENVGHVRQYGAELELTAPLHRMLELGFNYTYLHIHNMSNALKIIGVPEHKAFAYSRFMPREGLSLLVSGEYDSKRYSTTDGKQVAAEYAIANLKLGYEPIHDLVVEVGIDNVFDKNYAIDEGFPEPGRTWFAQARYRL